MNPRNVIPQGGVVSPTLFFVYINDIIAAARKRVPITQHVKTIAINEMRTAINSVSEQTGK